MKMEPIVSSETSAIRTQTPGNYPKRNNLHLEHGESLRTRTKILNFSLRSKREACFRVEGLSTKSEWCSMELMCSFSRCFHLVK